ncbi:hypothetical protein FHS78_003522 [Parvibaculum indicum]|uniref:hypothetical protein n=1 Tax=Parvibaculum indicum TaxID=562969 RepID=UPI001420378C|nr:hypothetical protein [Parvibaculum indicum]NIJ43210.1 hypothetical protein [Parvibaculum indicum]
MADYFTHFSCLLDVGTSGNAARALDIYNDLCAHSASEDPPSDGFLLSVDPAHGGSKLWMQEDGAGDPQRVIDFVLRCADAFALTGRWGFQWANTCSRPRINAFAGGAHVLDLGQRDTVAWIGTHGWLDDTIRGGRP